MTFRLYLVNSIVSTPLRSSKANDPIEAKLFPEKYIFVKIFPKYGNKVTKFDSSQVVQSGECVARDGSLASVNTLLHDDFFQVLGRIEGSGFNVGLHQIDVRNVDPLQIQLPKISSSKVYHPLL